MGEILYDNYDDNKLIPGLISNYTYKEKIGLTITTVDNYSHIITDPKHSQQIFNLFERINNKKIDLEDINCFKFIYNAIERGKIGVITTPGTVRMNEKCDFITNINEASLQKGDIVLLYSKYETEGEYTYFYDAHYLLYQGEKKYMSKCGELGFYYNTLDDLKIIYNTDQLAKIII